MLISMTAIRWLLGTVGVLLGVVLLILGVVLSPVLLLLALVPILVYLAWKFWRLRHKAGHGLEKQKKRARAGARKVKKSVKKSL
jgi:hypothetical protein